MLQLRRGACLTLCSWALGIVVGCASTPSWKAPTIQPPTVLALGTKCSHEAPVTSGNLYERCGKSGQISLAVYSSYPSVTGRAAPASTHVDSYGAEHADVGAAQ